VAGAEGEPPQAANAKAVRIRISINVERNHRVFMYMLQGNMK
jgi:hypothetical protein